MNRSNASAPYHLWHKALKKSDAARFVISLGGHSYIAIQKWRYFCKSKRTGVLW